MLTTLHIARRTATFLWPAVIVEGCGRMSETAHDVTTTAVAVLQRHAILVVLDTTRADVVAEVATPVIDGIASHGDAVELAWAAGTWTAPSVVSLFTGMSVRHHGWDLPAGEIGHYPKLPDAQLLAEVLKGAGFVTTGLYANDYLAPVLGFGRGFDVWRSVPDVAMVREVGREVATWKTDDRHFLYVHIMGPHSPVNPSPEAAARWHFDRDKWIGDTDGLHIGRAKRGTEEGVREAYRQGYYAEVEDTDRMLGEILDAIGPYRDDAVLVVTSDHGEMLGEHEDRFEHGPGVWETLTHVPLVAEGAGDLPDAMSTAAIADVITSSVGVHHTWVVNRATGLPLVSQREGRFAITPDGRLKGMWRKRGFFAYDLVADPGEQRPLSGREAEITAAREAWEKSVAPGVTSMDHVELAPETLEQLRRLGYLDAHANEADRAAAERE